MTEYAAIYLEINLIGVVLALLVLFRRREDRDRQVTSLAYNQVVLATLVLMLIDAVWVMVENRTTDFWGTVNYLVNILYLLDTGVIAYLWLRFVRYKLQRQSGSRRPADFLIALPLLVLALLCISSPWTHWLFEIGAGNVYRRGPLLFLQQGICYAYVLAGTVYALCCALREQDRERRGGALSLAAFAVLPTIGSLVNVLTGLPTIGPLTALSELMVYLNLQGQQISTDSLTGLNNRRQFDRYLNAQTAERRRDGRLYLFLIDVDDFKKINDTYGHPVGDDALVQTAGLLKRVCGGWSVFLARYGGDEFAIVLESSDPGAPKRLIRELHAAFERFNITRLKPYLLTLSIGCAAFSPEDGAAALIEAADRKLYEEKHGKKLAH